MIPLSLLVGLALVCCLPLGNGSSTNESLVLDEAMSRFSFNLYKELALGKTNAIYSPVSIHLGLSMAYLGAAGATAEEMRAALQIPNDTNIHEEHRKWLEDITTVNGTNLLVCNSVWSNPNVVVRQDYESDLTNRYHADVRALNFSSPDGPERAINDWVASRTANNIRDILPKGRLTQEGTAVVLVNTVYFNGTWEIPFDPVVTKTDSFRRPDATKVDVEFMRRGGSFLYKYKAFKGADLVGLPFSNSDISFFILLPKSVAGLAEIERGLLTDDVSLESLFEDVAREDLLVKMPKFRLEASMKLNQPLINLGVKRAFSTDADFSGVSEGPVRISQVSQKAVIEVTETGTFAGAATQIQEEFLVLNPFIDVSRSFMFFLRDDRSRRILFQGKMTDPTVREINID